MGMKGIGLKMDLEKVLDMTGSVFAIILTNIGAIKNEPVIIFCHYYVLLMFEKKWNMYKYKKKLNFFSI